MIADTNPHIINFYRNIATGNITEDAVRDYLWREGRSLSRSGEEHYYEVRERFNARPSNLDLLFLNRASFNGVMRFNKKGEFNVPFCGKPERFRRSYVTKIANQVSWASRLIRGRNWKFVVADWRETLSEVESEDFVYADPPYACRHADYFSSWTEKESAELLARLRRLPTGFALSPWKKNRHRSNPSLESETPSTVVKTANHFYHVGFREDLRGEMEETLIGSRDFATP